MSALRRGQATVELALGLLLLVPVVMLGWAFAESGFLSMKVTEAADSALWDSSADRRPLALAEAREGAQARYRDFDGRSASAASGPHREAGTVSEGLTVSCRATTVAITQPGFLDRAMAPPTARSCTATAQTRLFGGFTRTQCAYGRPRGVGGPCEGAQTLAIGDGALLNPAECAVSQNGGGCANAELFGKVDALYAASPPSQAPLSLVKATLRELPPHAATALGTYVSFRGEESMFEESVPYPGDGEFPRWQTTPYDSHFQYRLSYDARSDCYLGRPCVGTSLDAP